MIIQHHHYFHCKSDETEQLLKQLLTLVTQNQTTLKEIKMTDQEVSDLLDQVNATTNGIAAIQTADSTTLGTVKTELEALLAAPASGLTPATSDKLTALAKALGTVKTNSDSNSVLLTAIAAEGKPVVPPPPPPPPPPPVV